MIINRDGRNNSERTREEIYKLIGEDLDLLNEEEKEAVFTILEDLKMSGRSPLFEATSSIVYDTPPVSIETFIQDEFFLGKFSGTIYPSIKQDLVEIFNGQYTEVVLGGGIGGGKSSAAALIFLRMIYEVSCLKNPNEAFGMMPGDNIAFMCIAVTREVARGIMGDKIHSYMQQMPYFTQKFKPKKMLEDEIIFPKNIWIAPGGSNEGHTIGQNTFGALMEEANFHKAIHNRDGQKVDKADEIYNSIKRRMESRFKRYGRLPGKLIIVSSKTHTESFTEKIIKESIDNPDVFVRERPFYEAAPRERFSKETFRVAVGNETSVSRILGEREDDPEGQVCIDVPMDFRESFERNIDKAITDIAGVGIYALTPFIQRRDMIHKCIDASRVHPYPELIWHHDKPFKIDWNKICSKKTDPYTGKDVWIPKVNPSAPRHFRVDFSKSNDPTGLFIGHVSGMLKTNRSGQTEEYAPVFYVDLMLRVLPQTNGEVLQSEIRRLVYEFVAHGFFIKRISYDQFGSISFSQSMKDYGFETELLSVDRPNGAYEMLKQVIYENRINMYRYEPIIKELMQLQKDNKTGKVDHPKDGFKDCCDALCGGIFTLAASVASQFPNVKTFESVQQMVDEDNWVLDDGSVVVNDDKNNVAEDVRERIGSVKYDLPFEMG